MVQANIQTLQLPLNFIHYKSSQAVFKILKRTYIFGIPKTNTAKGDKNVGTEYILLIYNI